MNALVDVSKWVYQSAGITYYVGVTCAKTVPADQDGSGKVCVRVCEREKEREKERERERFVRIMCSILYNEG